MKNPIRRKICAHCGKEYESQVGGVHCKECLTDRYTELSPSKKKIVSTNVIRERKGEKEVVLKCEFCGKIFYHSRQIIYPQFCPKHRAEYTRTRNLPKPKKVYDLPKIIELFEAGLVPSIFDACLYLYGDYTEIELEGLCSGELYDYLRDTKGIDWFNE